MKTQNLHRIRKQTIEISFESSVDSTGLQNQVADVFYEKLQPRMEILFNEMFGKDHHTAFGTLEIDLGSLNLKDWEQEFTEQTMLKLKEELIQVIKAEIDQNQIEEIAAEEAFFFFLENGYMPWNRRIDSIAELEKLLRVNEKLISQLKKLVSQKSKAAERLVWQFSKDFTSRIITEITKDRENALTEIFALLEKLNLLQNGKLVDALTYTQIDRHILDAAILNLFASDKKNKVEQFFTFLLTKTDGNTELKAEIKQIVNYLKDINKNSNSLTPDDELKPEKDVKAKERGSDNVENEGIYINNAGLILIHPFLQTLFEHLGLTLENKWIDKISQQKAVLVSEFLITGVNEFEEFNLILNKIVCGFELDEIVATELELTDEIKTECKVLLNEVITHWSVLRNTSITGLRETFLQRSGKLSKVDDGWLLQVEQKSVDVLLNNLPWGIGIVKLPWMNELLYVEWT